MDKFKGKLPKDDLKRFAKEVRSYRSIHLKSLTYGRRAKISKKLVSSDFKNNRVEDPTKVSSRQEKHVKKYVKEYFDKAVAKKREHEKKKAERRSKEGESAASPTPAMVAEVKKEEDSDGDQDMAMSDEDEDGKPKLESATPVTPSDQLLQAERLKRKRAKDEDPDGVKLEDNEATPSKRHKSESPPPPPPPPPADGTPPDSTIFSEGGIDDGNRYRYAGNQSSGNTESRGISPENDSDSPPHHATSNDRTSAIKGDNDVSGNAHRPDAPMEYDEDEGLLGGKGQRHLSDIEVHGAA